MWRHKDKWKRKCAEGFISEEAETFVRVCRNNAEFPTVWGNVLKSENLTTRGRLLFLSLNCWFIVKNWFNNCKSFAADYSLQVDWWNRCKGIKMMSFWKNKSPPGKIFIDCFHSNAVKTAVPFKYIINNLLPTVKYHGLLNQGATCYLNSVLQVLFMTEDFRAAVERFVTKSNFIRCVLILWWTFVSLMTTMS